MTREEKISKEAWKYFHKILKKLDFIKCSPMGDWTDGLVRGFIKGAKWADKHPKRYDQDELCDIQLKMMKQRDKRLIAKACKWIEENKHLHKELSFGSVSTDWNKFIREFKKAMEE